MPPLSLRQVGGLTCDVGVSLLSPLGDKDGDLAVTSPPEVLHRYGNTTAGEDAVVAMAAEETRLVH